MQILISVDCLSCQNKTVRQVIQVKLVPVCLSFSDPMMCQDFTDLRLFFARPSHIKRPRLKSAGGQISQKRPLNPFL